MIWVQNRPSPYFRHSGVQSELWVRGKFSYIFEEEGSVAPKTTHYLFIFPDGAFLSRAQALVGKNRSQLLPQPNSPEAMGSESPEAHITALPRERRPVSGPASVFPIPGHPGRVRVALPAFVACDKRSQSPSVALKWTLTAPDGERCDLTS